MKLTLKGALAAVLFGLYGIAGSGAAHAESNTALQHAALHKACIEQGGRFEQSWIYNDQGMQWGKVLSCATSAGYVSCQGSTCRGGRWILRGGTTVADNGPDDNGGVVRFPAEPAAFASAVAALAEK